MKQVITFLTDKKFTKIIDQVRPMFKNVPHLPKGFVNFIVKVTPWLVGLGGVMGVLSSLSLIMGGLSGRAYWGHMARYTGMSYFSTPMSLQGGVQLISSLIMLLAFSLLKNRQKKGWILLFWIMALNIVESLLGGVFFSYYIGSIISMLIGLIIGLYFMFEIEGAYEKKKTKK